jgi:hypothetical protein
MGNAVSRAYDLTNCAYETYYPKNELVRPAYVSSALMISGAAWQYLQKQKPTKCQFIQFEFLASTSATLGLQLWISFVSGI